ncbi:unnamed protein product, partial [Dovyalis caffra]
MPFRVLGESCAIVPSRPLGVVTRDIVVSSILSRVVPPSRAGLSESSYGMCDVLAF